MTLNANGYHSVFQSFVDFAQKMSDSGMEKAVAAATVTIPLQGRGVLTVENGSMSVHISLASKKITLLFAGKAADAETKPLIDKAIEALIAEHTPPRSITIERVSPAPGLPDPWKPHYLGPVITC